MFYYDYPGNFMPGQEDHDHIHAEAPGNGGSGNEAAEVVTDHTAILKYLDIDYLRWNSGAPVGTPVVITYSFSATPDIAEYNPFAATGYWDFNTVQQTYFRTALAEFEAITGVIFVEIMGEAMINAFGSEGATNGGWANIAFSTETETGSGPLVINSRNMAPEYYGYQTILHELGHALGLGHPHEGGNRVLHPDLDTQINTVMTYNVARPYATDLGPFDITALQTLYGPANGQNVWTVSTVGNTPVIHASGRSETVLATGQSTHLYAGSGDDVVFGREGDDLIYGQAGNDTISGAAGRDSIYGGRGDDVIFGDIEIYSGFGDADFVAGGYGNDSIVTGYGDDRAYGQQDNDTILGGYGDDTLNGGSGDDSLLGESGNDRLAGIDGNDVLLGGFGNDTLSGGEGADSLNGESDDDLLMGGAGNDTLWGGWGDDHLRGDDGDDMLIGGNGDDLIRGGAGNDTLIGGDGRDRLLGGTGADVFVFQTEDAFERNLIYDFEIGMDMIRIEGLNLTFVDISIDAAGVTGAHTIISYSNWFDLVVFNTLASDLSTADFTFA